MSDLEAAFHRRWLGMVEPIDGLVLSVPVLTEAQCMDRVPPEVARLLADDEAGLTMPLPPAKDGRLRRVIPDLGRFLAEVLHLDASRFDRGDALPPEVSLYVPEGKETLRPTMALRGREPAEGYLLLVLDLPDLLDLDAPDNREGAWRYPPKAKLDRLLRAARVPLGLLTNREEFRLVYAPHGESTGAITFRLGDMASPGGREILDAFVMLLSAQRFFGVAKERQLPELCRRSRLYQANVTNELAEQVLDALAILLRGFAAAAARDGGGGLAEAYERGGDHLYGGLLTVLLRLVFVLYAEDTGLLPVEHPHYAQHLGVLGLFDQLQRDFAAFPDTMARRFGAWPRLCALFRAVYFGVERRGNPSAAGFAEPLRLPPRRGQLFDPEAHPFLEGWPGAGGAPVSDEDRAAVRVPTVDDATVYRVLERLVLHRGQRLSYRALDVEQIGSVYEALMGYHVLRLPAAACCLRPQRVWAVAAELCALPAGRRHSFLEDEAGIGKAQLGKVGKAIEGAASEEAMLAALAPLAVKDEERALAAAGAYVIQPGAERRRTSSHYTPRSLSAPIVARTLEPLLAAMGPEPTSEQILDLKVCDPAMGSGAFLVEACRYLADRVVASWTREGTHGGDEDPTLRARRLVAQRCLYGVDKNPFAVNLAKLSLWLVTLAKDEPFTFVDHALRHGDSLVGLDFDQIRAFHWAKEAQLELFDRELREALDEALLMRRRILALARENGRIKTEEKERLLEESEDAMSRVRLLGDLVVGAFFAHEKDKDRKAERNRRLDMVQRWLGEGGPPTDELREMQAEIRARIPVFHWMVEFPEVFWSGREDPLEGGKVNQAAFMDAFVGNPPFMGKNGISDSGGPSYVPWLLAIFDGAHGNADLSAYFFRRAHDLLGRHGTTGLIATSTIAQGDTRMTGLKHIVEHGGSIYAATRTLLWPGEAKVAASVVHVAQGALNFGVQASCVLDDREVQTINSRLRGKPERSEAQSLGPNTQVRFGGCKVYGDGFVLTPAERDALVALDDRNRERVFPFIGGEEINSGPTQDFERYVINFEQLPLDVAEQWPDLMKIVRERVKPERDKAKDNADGAHRKKYWWQFAQPRPEMLGAVRGTKRCLVNSEVSKHLTFAFQPSDRIFGHTLHVYALPGASAFAALQSRLHEFWAGLLSSTFGSWPWPVMRYSASECFETFPFPEKDPRAIIPALEKIGERLYTVRASYMISNNVGLTTTYNRLKDPDNTEPPIVDLRRLHEDMDRAVLAAYGWSDIVVPAYGTHDERFEDEIIDRLFALNAERAAEEKRLGATVGAKQKGAGKAKAAKPKGKGKQLGLLPDDGSDGSE